MFQPPEHWTDARKERFRQITRHHSFCERVREHNVRDAEQRAAEFPEGATDFDRRAVHPIFAHAPYYEPS